MRLDLKKSNTKNKLQLRFPIKPFVVFIQRPGCAGSPPLPKQNYVPFKTLKLMS